MKKLLLSAALCSAITAGALAQNGRFTVQPVALKNMSSKGTNSDWRIGNQFNMLKLSPIELGLFMGTDARNGSTAPIYLGFSGFVDLLADSKNNSRQKWSFGPAFGYSGRFDDFKHLAANGQFGAGLEARFTIRF